MPDRQRFDAAFLLQAMRRGCTPYLQLARFMQRLDCHYRIPAPLFDEDNAPVRIPPVEGAHDKYARLSCDALGSQGPQRYYDKANNMRHAIRGR